MNPQYLTIDFHSHVLPSMDDGSQDSDMSVEMLRRMGEMGVDTAFLFRKRFFIEKLLCIIWIGSVPLSALGLTECSHPKPDRFDVDEITHVRQRTGRVQDTDRLKNAGLAGLLSQRFYAPGDLTIKKLFGYAAKIRVFSFMV